MKTFLFPVTEAQTGRNEDTKAHEAAERRQQSQENQLHQRVKKRRSVNEQTRMSLPASLDRPGARKSISQKLLCTKQSLPVNERSATAQLDCDMQKHYGEWLPAGLGCIRRGDDVWIYQHTPLETCESGSPAKKYKRSRVRLQETLLKIGRHIMSLVSELISGYKR